LIPGWIRKDFQNQSGTKKSKKTTESIFNVLIENFLKTPIFLAFQTGFVKLNTDVLKESAGQVKSFLGETCPAFLREMRCFQYLVMRTPTSS